MKGIIFNLLEEAVSQAHGESTWDALVDDAGVSGVYTAVGTYPDEELAQLVASASNALSTPADDVVRWFGREALPMLAARYSDFFKPHTSTREFVLTLNDVIHPEVRKLFPGAYAPEFDFDNSNADFLRLGYTSYRNLCTFAEGLLQGAAAHFGEKVDINQIACTKRGDPKCIFECRFTKAAG